MSEKEMKKKEVKRAELDGTELDNVSGGMNMPILSEGKEDSLVQGILSREKLTYE